ncbi:MAG TPA: polyketide cyclase, partial [Algoriphagus sp.]|nr:polyketide cyclase [Algoriphagus sp.]
MKILKYVGLIVLIIIAIPLISALFISKDYEVVEKIIIERPIAEVYEFTKYLKNQD